MRSLERVNAHCVEGDGTPKGKYKLCGGKWHVTQRVNTHCVDGVVDSPKVNTLSVEGNGR